MKKLMTFYQKITQVKIEITFFSLCSISITRRSSVIQWVAECEHEMHMNVTSHKWLYYNGGKSSVAQYINALPYLTRRER